MNIIIKNKGKETLDKKHYVASGGEGHIYVKNGLAYKIYNSPTKMIPEKKIQELSVLNNQYIIKPEDVILDSNNKSIGYTMKYINDTVSLCQLFTKSFKDRNFIKPQTIVKLINQMRDTILFCHKHKILIVDLNELNFLVDKTFINVYFIDVDSYQTPSFPATALMESIRDRHSKCFSENTDWFSFGIISFQMFTGIHPYKGKHIKYKDLDSRMLNNISVFNSQVSVPPIVSSFDIIPEDYKKWYKKIFETQNRLPPPFDGKLMIQDVVVKIKTVTGTNNFDIKLIFESDGDIIDIKYWNREIIITNKGFQVDQGKLIINNEKFALSCVQNKNFILGSIDHRKLKLKDFFTNKNIPCDINAIEVFSINENVYIKTDDSINKINFTSLPNGNIIVSQEIKCNILFNATQIFDEVIIQNLLDAYYISILDFNGHHQIKINELQNYRIINAKYSRQVLMVCAEKKGKYDNFIFKFDLNFQEYSFRKIEDVDCNEPEFVVLDNGVCAYINEKGFLELSYSDKDNNNIKVIEDTILEDAKLFCRGNQVLFSKGNKLYEIKIK
ncbi:MAG: hypothetical protein PHP92_03905 [Candidatus Nanoarchaeia archaeon]|nr:hypothetical protein [Candidatus Nanoarchaeia archaeon]